MERMKKMGVIVPDWKNPSGGKGKTGVVRGRNVRLVENGDAILVNGVMMQKPFVEKVRFLIPLSLSLALPLAKV